MSTFLRTTLAFSFLIAGSLLLTASVSAAEWDTKPLWEGDAPGAIGNEDKDRPKIHVSLPDEGKATGAAVLVCPGGGYGGLAMGHEGQEIADWLNAHGIASFVLDYRHRGKGYGHPAPLTDAQRGMRWVRAHAQEYGVDPKRVGVMGFSAGGHLASTLSTHFDAGQADAADAIDRQSCRPDFAILCYPVIQFDAPTTHRGSQKNLLGENADPALVASLSNEKQVTEATPPTFLFATDQDTAVPPENAVAYYLACRAAKVPAELHVFETGPHGVGLAKNIEGVSQWPDLCIAWLNRQGLLGKKAN